MMDAGGEGEDWSVRAWLRAELMRYDSLASITQARRSIDWGEVIEASRANIEAFRSQMGDT